MESSSLKYRIDDISPKGTIVRGTKPESWLRGLIQGLEEVEIDFVTPIFYHIQLFRSDATILVEGKIDLKVELTCSRCLEKFVFSINPEFKFSLAPANDKKFPLEMRLQKEDLNIVFYTGDSIDVGEIIFNQIILNIPLKPLCREDCQGLCPQCGINKNIETCKCSQEKIVDPRLEVLKKLFPNKHKK